MAVEAALLAMRRDGVLSPDKGGRVSTSLVSRRSSCFEVGNPSRESRGPDGHFFRNVDGQVLRIIATRNQK
jgi:hypothetical protein